MAAAAASAAVLIGMALLAPPAAAHCPGGNPDLPQCACQSTGASWPAGLAVDEVIVSARRSLTAQNSCLRHGGQPYWQIQLQVNFPEDAHTLESLDPGISTDIPREAWCSETIAWWHFMSLMPFLGGYGNPDWHPSSYVKNVPQLRLWYRTEERMRQEGLGGRGRWIGGGELDYENFQPGVNAPCPGAYQALEAYNSATGNWADSCHHSQLVDSMVIWRLGNATGPIQAVDVHVIEGNAGGGQFVDVNGVNRNRGTVRNTIWFRNVIEYTRLGDQTWGCGGRKIRGWGIDLHADGTTYCDPGRITTIVTPFAIAFPAPIGPDDPDSSMVEQIMTYVKTRPGPIQVTASASAIQTGGALPDRSHHWVIPTGPFALDPAWIQVDFRAEHPLPVRGVVVDWKGGIVPSQYQVLWGGDSGGPLVRTYNKPSGVTLPPTTQGAPIPLAFGPAPNYRVRHLRVAIPGSALTRPFEIQGLHFLFDYGKEDDGGDVDLAPPTTGVGDGPAGGDRIRIAANAPNPFRERTVIAYELPVPRQVTIAIYDLAGRLVRRFGPLPGAAGLNQAVWDGRDDSGGRVGSGTYFLEVQSGGERGRRRMVFLR